MVAEIRGTIHLDITSRKMKKKEGKGKIKKGKEKELGKKADA